MTSTNTATSMSFSPIASGYATPFTIEKSALASSSASILHRQDTRSSQFRSRRYNKENIQQPWLAQKHPREKFAWILPLIGLLVGLVLTGIMCWLGLSKVPHHSYCPILNEDFSSGTLDSNVWTKEVSVGGFGNGDFEQTTDSDENAFIQDGNLYIKPTLQDASLIENDNILNLFGSGCTGQWTDCVAVTNVTNGTIINPVKSARLTTLNKASIKYGRVEVVAQMPKGDWLWPAIWMLPVNNTYGVWPASGEIDIAELRGNNASYPAGGINTMRSTLHWGPDSHEDAYLHSTNTANALHTTYATGFHTYGLEWSSKYLLTWVDSRLDQVYYTNFNAPFWNRGDFPAADPYTGQALVNPWGATGSDATPFDQDFYLILNVAVGSTNGYFADGVAGKPWVDESVTAKRDFWNAQNEWYPTWQKDGQMIVKSVKMFQEAGYNGCK